MLLCEYAGFCVCCAYVEFFSRSRACLQATPNQYGKLSTVTRMPKPKPECMVCGHALACLFVDLQTFTFQQLLDRVLKKEMAFSHPTVMCENFLYEEGDDLDEDEVAEYAHLLPKTLAMLPGSITHNTRLEVNDQAQNLKVTVVLQQQVRSPGSRFAYFKCMQTWEYGALKCAAQVRSYAQFAHDT